MRVATKARFRRVDPTGDGQPGLVLAAGIYGPCQFGAIRLLAALDFDEVGDKLKFQLAGRFYCGLKMPN